MKKNMLIVGLMIGLLSAAGSTATIAHWNFEDGVDGQPFTPAGQPNGSGGSADAVNGYMMYGWNDYWGPSFTSHTISGALGMRNAERHQDGYAWHDDLVGWAPAEWTVECTVKLLSDSIGRWSTFIGKDGSAEPGVDAESVFYLQKTWNNFFRINVRTAGGPRYVATSSYTMEANKWYGIAATSDGLTLKLYVNDHAAGTGWDLAASVAMDPFNDNSMPFVVNNWTFGRGWWNTWFVDHIDGYMDDIRFSDVALSPSEFLVPEPATMLLLGLGALVSLRKRK